MVAAYVESHSPVRTRLKEQILRAEERPNYQLIGFVLLGAMATHGLGMHLLVVAQTRGA